MTPEFAMPSHPELLDDLARPPAAPFEYAGQWVAWDRDEKTIVAHGKDMAEVHRAAKAAGHADCVMQKVPPTNTIFVGAS